MHVTIFSQLVICIILIVICIITYKKLNIPVIKKYPSKLNKFIDVRKRQNGELYLTLNGYTQGIEISKENVEKSYWYFIADAITQHCRNIEVPQILLLGLGAGTVPHIVNKMNPKIHMTIVEFDHVVIQACKEYFSLDTLQNITIVEADALKLIPKENAFDKHFDAILIDLFISDAPYVSPESQTYSFIKQVTSWGTSESLYVFNRPANDDFAKKDQIQFMQLIQKVFKEHKQSEIVDPRNYWNYVITAKKFQPLTT